MPRRKADAQSHSVSLHIAPSFISAWDEVVLPWFQTIALSAIESAEPVAIVTPHPSAAAFLRSKLLEHDVDLLGAKFVTPPVLREILVGDAAAIPMREHLRLLLAIAAESTLGQHSEDPGFQAIAKSIARSPDNLLGVVDQLSAAGWNLEEIGTPAVREIAGEFFQLVRRCDFQFLHEADRTVLQSAATRPKSFGALLVTGFTAAHWGLFSLLHAAILSARRATIVLDYPREQTRAADESWIGTWEQIFGSAQPVADQSERRKPFAELIQTEAARKPMALPCFLVGLNTTEQAQAISAAALKFLAEQSCTRLGILFARPGGLPRLVSELLTRSGIAHYDGIGHLAPGETDDAAWSNWIHLQENRRLEPLLRFLETHPRSSGEVTIDNVRTALRSAHRELLLDDISVLREYCARHQERAGFDETVKILGSIKFLPAKATLRDYLAETKQIFAALQWEDRWSALKERAREWTERLPLEFPRAIYLRWLKEVLDSFSISRAAAANHPYSRVHLLTYPESESQEWPHLILAGLNHGEWPPAERESGFLPDEQIARLNNRATRPGAQGEGHVALASGKTFLLSSRDQRQIALRQFAAAVESAEHGLAVTASLLQDSAPERIWNPSELLNQIYFATSRTPLSQETMSILREKTSDWLTDQSLFQRETVPNGDVEQTRVAYAARRRADVPFGEYEFALRRPLNRTITLRVTEWQRAVKTPALVWLKTYLGVENDEPDLNQWSATTGSWMHDWLANIANPKNGNAFVPFPSQDQIHSRMTKAARDFRESIVDLCAAANRSLPDWWSSGWSNALALADFLASKLAEVQSWPQLSAEWKLDSREVTLATGENLRVRGRIDLILAQKQTKGSLLADNTLWIVDYKTGNVKSLSVSARTPEARLARLRQKLVRGDAIQLGFYGLAAREQGATDVQLSILSLRTDLDKPQLVLDDLAGEIEFWREVHRMQETGIFGLRGAIRNEFAFHADYPLAVLPIDKEFLDEKWVLTHPAFADEEDDRA